MQTTRAPFAAYSFRIRVALLGLMSATALSACATLPADGPAHVAKAPETYAASQALAAPERDWPADAWWTAYSDTQLNTLMGEALAGSPTLAAAQARVRRAEAVAAQAHAQQLPSVSANGSRSRAITPAYRPPSCRRATTALDSSR